MEENSKCRNCSDVKYRSCTAPNIITNGKYCCENETEQESLAVCSQCGEKLVIGHFAYEKKSEEFWCEECLRDLYESSLDKG